MQKCTGTNWNSIKGIVKKKDIKEHARLASGWRAAALAAPSSTRRLNRAFRSIALDRR